MAIKEQVITDRYALYCGDCCEVMPTLPDGCVHLSVYSPPFCGMYNYSSSERDLSNCRNHVAGHRRPVGRHGIMRRGSHHTAEAREKMSRAFTDEHRAAISAALTGLRRGPDTWEHKQARIAAQRARRARELETGERRWGGRIITPKTGGTK